MVKNIKLEVKKREKETKITDIKKAGFLPAVLYGQEMEPKNIQIKAHDFKKIYESAGEAALVDISIDGGEPIKTLIKDVQKENIGGKFIHADFYAVNMKKKISVEIPLNFIGESKAEKEMGGTLVKSMETIHISCLPSDLVEHIDVDLSSLTNFHETIQAGSIKLPENIELVSHPHDVIVNVIEPKVEEEVKPVVAETVEAGAEVKSDGKDAGKDAGKKEAAKKEAPKKEAGKK
jgi:large subunit ribosomal protein L25